MISMKSIAIYRAEDMVVIWQDTPEGWELFDKFTLLSRADRAQFILRLCMEYKFEDNYKENGEMGDVLLLPLRLTSVPPEMPSWGTVGIHPSLMTEGVPVFNGKEVVSPTKAD